jgi:CRISPR-associated protein Csx3
MKVVLCGPPHSGKSCLRHGLKQVIQALNRKGQAPYPYFITACPDGEGSWYAETVSRDPILAEKLKKNYKSKFTPEFAQRVADDVKNTPLSFNLIDVGGKIDDKNRLIMQYATHAVIISRDLSLVADWLDFCGELNLKVIAILESNLYGTEDKLESEFPILRGSIHGLKRGEDVSTRLMVNKLAEVLLRLI